MVEAVCVISGGKIPKAVAGRCRPNSHAAKALDLARARRAALGFWSDGRWRHPDAAQAASYGALCLRWANAEPHAAALE